MEKMKKYIAESFGTMVLVLFGCGAAVFAGDSLGVLGIAFAFGLVIVAMAYTVGPVSGCHINPAVSLAMFVNKRLTLKEFLGYALAQVIGAILGSALLYGFLKMGDYSVAAMGQNFFGAYSYLEVLAIEVVLTFVFIAVIMVVTSKKNGNSSNAGLVIGLTLVLIHILGITLTGTSVNPARSIGPAIFTGGKALKELWVFVVAPLIGGLLAAIFSKKILGSEE